MFNEPIHSDQSTANRVISTLMQLVAKNPDKAKDLSDVMLYIRSLEERCQESNRLHSDQNSKNRFSKLFVYERKLEPHAYNWSDTALREYPHGHYKSHLQVSLVDYKAVAQAIESCLRKTELLSVAEIRDETTKFADRKIPSTQLYLCIRYWRANNIVTRAGGRRLKVTDDSLPFSQFASKLIESQ